MKLLQLCEGEASLLFCDLNHQAAFLGTDFFSFSKRSISRCFKTAQGFTFIEIYEKYLLKFSFMNNFDIMWDHYACTWFGCHFEICSWDQQRCFFSYSVYNWQRERERWEKASHEDWEPKLPHRLKVRMHYCTVLKCFIPCISTVLNALAQVKHAVGFCFFHIPVLVLLEVQMGRNLQNWIIWILMCHCLGWSISVFVLIPEDWYLKAEQLVS